ncbi:MAG: hypothetical protein U9Q81_19890 [Pseudomonadota bacterium]|nr:hypothetical protein [Pseudomonadota bacterium]
MKTLVRFTLVSLMLSVMMLSASPAFSAQAMQMWKCEMDDDATEDEVNGIAREWLKAAKGMKGGDKLEAFVYWPVAVNDTGESDFFFVVVAPSFEEWGKFWDGYKGSPAAQVDNGSVDKVDCPDSAVWESIKVE